MIRKRVTLLTGIVALILATAIYIGIREFRQREMMAKHEVWQKKRLAELTDVASGWLNLAGLFWMEEGKWTMGSARGNNFVLREGNAPDRVGTFVRQGEEITFQAQNMESTLIDGAKAPAEPVLMKDDGEAHSVPTVVSDGQLQWWIISRDGLLGVRVRDLESLHLKNFAGIDSYALSADWNVAAQFLPFESPRQFEYPTILGTTRMEEAPGVLVFELDGQQFEMIPFERNEGKQLFLVFGDPTNGGATYEGGRFLYVDMPDERGETTIDFNRAYNPPCAFTPYSTCPQPLRQNRLSVSVIAGEKVYKKPEASKSPDS